MSFNTLQNTPITLDLALQARSTGWSLNSGIASHESCNAGYIYVVNSLLPIITGQSYTISYQVANRTSGMIQLSIGTTQGNVVTTNGNNTETLIAGGVNPSIKFYSDGTLDLKLLDIKPNNESISSRQRNTVAFHEPSNKWPTFFPFTSDYGFSFFKDLFTFKGGRLFKHNQDVNSRNNIYGVQYASSVKIPFNAAIGEPKTFNSLSYEGNQLMITTINGVTTSLGQVSELIALDFLKDTMIDGINQVNIYDVEGVYSATFMRDKNVDIVNGDELKGTMITIELVTTGNDILKLKNVFVNSDPSKIGAR